ncbi:cholesterol transporter ABCA5 [Xenopus laevis]|uniref:Cholesterol transporter ABCA5 n=2 Tax=Xenopus laevis TaxID=8355 RepID=A0A1L8ERP1_XENLA|nr:cholesterol transporter ABCA5 [Xenopus laevis]OCT61980.1 hypothetical protein XELAEV_18043064mg [Xenopus laevis]
MTSEIKDVGLWRQTRTLLYKNYLIKCRTKRDSIQEILYPIIWWLISLLWASMVEQSKHYEAMPNTLLGGLDGPSSRHLIIGYTPESDITQQIMALTASECYLTDITFKPYLNEEHMKTASSSFEEHFVGVVFDSSMSYKLRFSVYSVPDSTLYITPREDCHLWNCEATEYFYSTFTYLQACIDSSIIKMKTNYSSWEELKTTRAVIMGEQEVVVVDTFYNALMSVFLVMAFSPLGYSVVFYVVFEKEKKVKEFMKLMGLHDTAFWLPWVLLYTGFILVISLVMAVVATTFFPFSKSNCFLIFLLYALYGISLVLFALMLAPLFKNSKRAGAIVFLSTLVLGAVGIFIVLKEDFPNSFVWFFSPFCQCTFMIGIAQVLHLEDFQRGAQFTHLKDGPYPLVITFIFLVVDSVMYLLLATYLDQVLPGEYGLRQSPFFFLKPSYWSKRKKRYGELNESYFDRTVDLSEMIEPVSSELHGKEAIRICCICKSFRKNNKPRNALQGLTFDIYEGQITALVGHSGTGKTTLMNILCGLCPPTEGFATVYGHRVTDIDEIQEASKMIGICQQTDIFFDVLTVEENLHIFASLRGIDEKTKEQEINKILFDLDMQALKHNHARTLSIGQKRKLSVAIAVLGNPKVLLLDEPTAGMDSCSRHTVWNLLKNRKGNHVTVFSTHCMEEADILADRKAVISQGSLKCIGSSLFLKSKWGVGYRLSMDIKKPCDVDALSSLITQHISGASLMQQSENSLLYSLPLKDVNKFPGLFSALDSGSDLGIITYGVSATTLEDVFFKLETEAEIDQSDNGIFSQRNLEDEGKWKSMEDIEQGLLELSLESSPCSVSGSALWKQQVATVAKLHFRNLHRETKSLRCMCLCLLFFLVPQVTLYLLGLSYHQSLAPIRLSADMYFSHPKLKSHKFLTSLLLQNSTGENIDELLGNLNSQKIKVDLINGSDYISASPHNAVLNVFLSGKHYTYEAIFNASMVHSLPVLINTISNTVLRQLGVNESIEVWNSPFYQDFLHTSYGFDFYFLIAYLGIMTGMLPYIAMENAYNYKVKAYSQLKMAGLYPSAYWVGQAAVDMPLFFLMLLFMVGSMLAFKSGIDLHAGTVVAMIFCLIGYVPAVVLLTYVVSFTYKLISDTRQWWSLIFAVTASISIIIIEAAIFFATSVTVTRLHVFFSIFFPVYPLLGCLTCFIKMSRNLAHSDVHSLTQLGRLLVAVFAPYVHSLIFFLILRYLEMKNGGRSIRKDSVFRSQIKKTKPWKFAEVPEDEDEDVRVERARVGEYMAPDCNEKPMVLVSGLHKEQDQTGKTILGKAMRKLVVNNVSFCVRKGETLGLVGPNGAGKSTLLNMLVGQSELDAGQILMGDPAAGETGLSPPRFVGYSPQINYFWPEIKLQEHLDAYGAIKGMNSSVLKEVTRRIVETLDLKEHLQEPAKKLSVGNQRKLSFALSMLGNPDIVLLEEPSTGMDPKNKQIMWKLIRTTLKGKEQAAVITTHSMEEAEAICDRVAIMVSGQLRYIGSVQHLKSKFGRYFSLELKLDTRARDQNVELIHKEILQIFPNASHQESFSSLMSYKVPKEDVESLSQTFSELEQVKQMYNIEEYIFSQATLEQVFIELAKEQEEEDNIATMNSTLWWERRQEDRVIF